MDKTSTVVGGVPFPAPPTKYLRKLSPHIAESIGYLSSYDVDGIFEEANRFKWEKSSIDNEGDHLLTIRSGMTKGLVPDDSNSELYEYIVRLFTTFNEHVIHQDWYGFVETLQFAKYSVGDHYDYHFDGFEETKRKLSLSIQLSSPDDYEGGLLKVGLPNNPVTMDVGQGTVACFPSWMPHTVEPVTKGIRYSLVAWGHGPPVR